MKTHEVRTHDDPPKEYHPGPAGQSPLLVDALKLEGIFPPKGTVDVNVREHEDGYPVLVYQVALTDEDWAKVRRAFEALKNV